MSQVCAPFEVSDANLAQQLVFEEQRVLYDYWQRIRGVYAMPARDDLDPADIPRVLPHMGLIDIVQPGPRFRYRLVGTALGARFPRRLEGRFVEDCKSSDYAAYLRKVYGLIHRLQRPVLVQERTSFVTGFERGYARLLLPLGRDHVTPDMILYSTMSDADLRQGAEEDSRQLDPDHCDAVAVFAAIPA